MSMITVKNLLAQKAQREIRHVVATDSVLTVLELMKAHTIRSVVVLDDAGHLIGIASERDCALKVLLKDLKAADTKVSEIMTADVITVSEESTVDDCMHHMSTKSIRHLPVCKDGKVIGMVSVGDVVKELIRHQAELIGYLEGYIRGRVAG